MFKLFSDKKSPKDLMLEELKLFDFNKDSYDFFCEKNGFYEFEIVTGFRHKVWDKHKEYLAPLGPEKYRKSPELLEFSLVKQQIPIHSTKFESAILNGCKNLPSLSSLEDYSFLVCYGYPYNQLLEIAKVGKLSQAVKCIIKGDTALKLSYTVETRGKKENVMIKNEQFEPDINKLLPLETIEMLKPSYKNRGPY